MDIVFIGNSHFSQNSYLRYKALKRLGHRVTLYNPYEVIAPVISNPIISRVHYYSGYRFLQKKIIEWLEDKKITNQLIWVDNGELLGYEAVKHIKNQNNKVILYNTDDPTGTRDKGRFTSLVEAIPLYDLIVTIRESTLNDLQKLNSKICIRVFCAYDEEVHNPPQDAIPSRFQSDVAFIGTWIRHEKRDNFILELIKSGINVAIWGDGWQKGKHWSQIKANYRGSSIYGTDYVNAIAGAKINLGLLSKGNRDFHTSRSIEVPYIGSLLCAERTSEHQWLYEEGKEAVFWSSVQECASVCKELLQDDEYRNRIKDAGREKVLSLKLGNEDMCKKILTFI